ncbi:hypothetical protein BGZ61DRAFT_464970, partial [Ilyonectria robusta]|uniref:uncharacterized protein n=1 Tax=Ilyonectria robusta TaxID=1079257 RepID=UPI001E8E935A
MGLRHWRREMELSTSHMPDEEKEDDDMAMTNWRGRRRSTATFESAAKRGPERAVRTQRQRSVSGLVRNPL